MKKIFLAIIAIIVFTACFAAAYFTVKNTVGKNNETTTEAVRYNTDINGELVPSFADVSACTMDPSLYYRDENGRMRYEGEDIKAFTGIDVSVFQGDIDWESVKADGIDFVMLRAGYRGYGSSGLLGEDDNFRKNAIAAVNAGLDVGVYFFSQAVNAAEAAEEARFVLELVKDIPLTYPIAYDWEIIDYDTARTDNMTSAQITECAVAFCDTVKQAGYIPLIYFNCEVGYFNYDLSKIRDYHFWLAEYSDIPAFYYDYKIWQYTKEGRVAGVNEAVDINICLTDYSSDQASYENTNHE